MLKEFRAFIARGNVLDLAVAVIIGAAFSKIVTSLTDYAALKKAGVPLLGYGAYVTQAVNFVIVAFIIFLLIRTVNRATAMFEKDKAVAAAEPKAEPADVALLREIRDELRARRS